MKSVASIAALLVLVASVRVGHSEKPQATGVYVEARTAEVFAGGCIMNSEAETAGRQAVLAWHITAGSFQDLPLDGLSVVAAVAGERNLGMREMGGEGPGAIRAVITVDARANERQHTALVDLAFVLSHGLITEVVRVDTAPIRFVSNATSIEVRAGDTIALSVSKEMKHDPTCGAMQWFKPFVSLTTSAMGTTEEHAFSGTGLGTKWSAPNKRSSFYGVFSY